MAGLGSLVLSLVAESSEFIADMGKAERKVASSTKAMKTSIDDIALGFIKGEIAMQALGYATEQFAKSMATAGQVMDSTEMFGTAPAEFYKMKIAVEAAGEELGNLPDVLSKLNKVLKETGSDADGPGKLLKDLGLNLKELQAMDPALALKAVGTALQDLDDPALRAALGAELMGKGYKDAAPALKAFSESQLDTTIATIQQISDFDALGDRLNALKSTSADAALSFMGSLSPSIQVMMDATIGATNATGKNNTAMEFAVNVVKVVQIAFLGLVGTLRVVNSLWDTSAGWLERIAKGDLTGAGNVVANAWNGVKGALQGTGKQMDAVANSASIAAGKAADEASQRARDDFKSAERRAAMQEKLKEDMRKDSAAAAAKAAAAGRANAAISASASEQKKIEEELFRMRTKAASALETPIQNAITAFAALNGVTAKQKAQAQPLIELQFKNEALRDFQKALDDVNVAVSTFGSNEIDKALAVQERAFIKARVSAAEYVPELEKLRQAMQTQAMQKFATQLIALDAELAAVSATPLQLAMAAAKKSLSETGVPLALVAADLQIMQDKLLAISSAKFVKEMEAADLAIAKIGKGDFAQKSIDLEQTYKLRINAGGADGNAAQGELKAAQDKLATEYQKRAGQTISDVNADIASQEIQLIGTPDEKILDEYRKLAKDNPFLNEAEFEQVMKNKQAMLEYTAAVTDFRSGVKTAGTVAIDGLAGMLDGTKSLDDAMDDLGKSIQKMLVQALLLKPLEKQLNSFADNLFSEKSGGGAKAPSGGGGGGFLASLWDGAKSFLGLADGGPVMSNQIVEVAEGNVPELYRQGNKTYLLGGAGGGQVIPAKDAAGGSEGSGGGGGNTFHFSIDARGADAGVDQKIRAAVAEAVQTSVATVAAKAGRGGAFAKQIGRA